MLMSAHKSLAELENASEFQSRHIGPEPAEEQHMLGVIGAASRHALIEAIVPRSIARARPMALPAPLPEAQALAELRAIASMNKVQRSFIGQGYHGTHTPGVILRNVLENPAWYTAYTPYQAEISQGRMEALVNFQTMVTELTGMAIANASLLDEATAAAEAMTLAARVGKSKSKTFYVADDVLPQTLEVVQTRARPLGLQVVTGPARDAGSAECFAALLQYPGVSGRVHHLQPIVDAVHANGALAIVAADLLALTLLVPPGEQGADIVVGNTQRFGMPMCNGGPHAAYMATRDEFKRSLPGRLVGVSVDAQGAPAYRLALQTREQHIRREKATSNICTAQVLPAVVASMYAVYHGPAGLKRIAQRVASYTAVLAAGLQELGCKLAHDERLRHARGRDRRADRCVVRCRGDGRHEPAPRERGNAFHHARRNHDARRHQGAVVRVRARQAAAGLRALRGGHRERCLPAALLRTQRLSSRHPVFNSHHSETEMLRYMRSLSDKDLALDRSMIPLGSCTMKLNATSEMIPVTWPEFANIHPFAPADQLQGYALLDRATVRLAVAGDRLCGHQPAAQRRIAGRVRGAARDPGMARVARRRPSQHLPDPGIGARHQPGERADGGPERRRREMRCDGQRRSRRPGAQVHAARRATRVRDDHLPVDLRRVRNAREGAVRAGASARRACLRRRREHECVGGHRGAGRIRRRREPSEPAQDLLHPARRRRARRRAGVRGRGPGAVPARASHRGGTSMRPASASGAVSRRAARATPQCCRSVGCTSA